jgi:Domain of unknown function (DUF4838)
MRHRNSKGLLLSLASAAVLAQSGAARGSVPIAEHGSARTVIVIQAGALPGEVRAAEDLASTLKQITGAEFNILRAPSSLPKACIVVGQGNLASDAFPNVPFASLEPEQLVMETSGSRLLLAGGKPRGTQYAIYRFLQKECGVRWWTPWAATVPSHPNLRVPDTKLTEKPAFESRDPFWYPAFNADWAARNFSNSEHAHLDEAHGGAVTYEGFVHTFYPLVPPEQYAEVHPEWYALVNGKRTFENAQLCTTNPELRELILQHIKDRIKANPGASIVSLSQNDCFNPCTCPLCKAIDDAQASYSGTMIALVNWVAECIAKEYPTVAIDTLAYQYTRKAPKDIKPLPNVIVRLCSIECNFAAPLSDQSNKKFADDIIDWNRLTKRLYIWDYTTNFAHYMLPQPNWFVLGPNLRFFHDHGAKGVFEQGAYQSVGSEMSEMRAWVLAQLLWNPYQDDKALIKEFLRGYYGPAAPSIYAYLELLSREAKGENAGCYTQPDAKFLALPTLAKAEQLWQEAEKATSEGSAFRMRVRQAHLPVLYTFLCRWQPLKVAAIKAGLPWPVSGSRKAVAAQFMSVAAQPWAPGWPAISVINEGGTTPQAFAERMASDPPEPRPLPARNANPAPPPGLSSADLRGAVDVQDGAANLFRDGELSEVRGDNTASDGLAVWMPGSHHEWAVQIPFSRLPSRVKSGKWKIYAVVRADTEATVSATATAMTMGVYDTAASKPQLTVSVPASQIEHGYRSVCLGSATLTAGSYIWFAPTATAGISSVWIDRVIFVPDK